MFKVCVDPCLRLWVVTIPCDRKIPTFRIACCYIFIKLHKADMHLSKLLVVSGILETKFVIKPIMKQVQKKRLGGK